MPAPMKTTAISDQKTGVYQVLCSKFGKKKSNKPDHENDSHKIDSGGDLVMQGRVHWAITLDDFLQSLSSASRRRILIKSGIEYQLDFGNL